MSNSSKIMFITVVAIMVIAQVYAKGAVKQDGVVMGQTSSDCRVVPLPGGGARPIVEGGSATVIRTKNGVTASVSLPTPQAGTYCYPPMTLAGNAEAGPAMAGHPEVFTFWGIYFNNPEECGDGECGAKDVLGPTCGAVQAGAIKLSGHVVGGGNLHLSGHISAGEAPLLGCSPLSDVLGAEIHLAVAPHGLMMPSLMPAQIQVPPGGGPGYWFPAIFLPAD